MTHEIWIIASILIDIYRHYYEKNFHHPICSMYGIFTYIYPKNQPNVGKYAIHGASGHNFLFSAMIFQVTPMVAMVHGSKGDEHQCYVNENTGDAKPVGSPVVM